MAPEARRYRQLVIVAIALTVGWGALEFYRYFSAHELGDLAWFEARNAFADQHYTQALNAYERALAQAPEHLPAQRGRAETLIMLQREAEAVVTYDHLIGRGQAHAADHANRAIALDRLGQHREALIGYRMALSLDNEVGDGPSWLTRFLRNQSDAVPGIAERAAYLEAQFALPSAQRVLRIEARDAAQRPYQE